MANKSEDESDKEDKSSTEGENGEDKHLKDGSTPKRNKHKRSKHSKKKSKKKSKKSGKSRKRHRDRSSSGDESGERSNSEKAKRISPVSSTVQDSKEPDSTSKTLASEQLDTSKQPGEVLMTAELGFRDEPSDLACNSRGKCPDVCTKGQSVLESPNRSKESDDNKSAPITGTSTLWSRSVERLEERLRAKKRSEEPLKSKEKSKERLRSKERSKSTNRSRSREPSKEVSTLKNVSRTKSKSKSKERSESPERSKKKLPSRRRSKERSRKRSREQEQSKSKYQPKETSRSRKRSEERSRERSKSRSRSKERSKKKSRSKERLEERSRERAKSRSRSKERSKKKSRSKERAKSRSRSKENSRSKERSKKKSRSKERAKSSSRSKENSRSKKKSRSKERLKKKSRSKERSMSKDIGKSTRRRSRSKERSRQRSQSKGRSWSRGRWNGNDGLRKKSCQSHSSQRSRERRSRSTERRYSPPRYRDNRNYGRQRSRSFDRRRQSRSRSRTRYRSDYAKRSERSRSRSAEPVAASVPINLTIALGVPTTTVTTTTASIKPPATDSETKSIADFTALCKKLTEFDSDNDGQTKLAEEQVLHPFKVKPAREIYIQPRIFPVSMPKPPANEPNKPLEQAFPVSSGNQHKTKEDSKESSIVEGVDGSVAAAEKVFQITSQQEKLDVSGLIAKRLEAQNRLLSDPNDFEARLVLEEVQMKIQNWAAVNLKPGQFTGESLVKNMLPKEGINSGYQAWAKKNMFLNLAPITGGVGMRLLEKMGWKPGQVLGKRGEGNLEPIALSVKMDRKGLISCEESGKGGKGGPRNVVVTPGVQGKHPVSALAEFCTKKRWQPPVYNVVHESGPDHKKHFLYQVLVNGSSYQFNVASNNKKFAKAQAAFTALKVLGLVPANATM